MRSLWTGFRLGCLGLAVALAVGCEEGERRQLSDDVDAVVDDVGEAVQSGARELEAGTQELLEQVDEGAREVRRQVDQATERVQEEVEEHRRDAQ